MLRFALGSVRRIERAGGLSCTLPQAGGCFPLPSTGTGTNKTRAFSKRIWSAIGNAPANISQAGNYSAVLHYL